MKYRAMKASVRLCGSAVALLALCSSAPAAPQQVDLKLVLAVDVSGSIDSEEFQLEREGTADAFADPEVLKAIQGGSLGKIAVAMLDFSSPQFDKVVIDWTIIKDKASAMAFAETSAIRLGRRAAGLPSAALWNWVRFFWNQAKRILWRRGA